MRTQFFTIGHAARPIAQFVELLREAEIQLVVVVRAMPRSRANPQFNRDALPKACLRSQSTTSTLRSSRGLRARSADVSPSVNAFWENPSFHNYADYAMSECLRSGLMRLRQLGHAKRSAIMCAETVWWRCHRRIITDYLLVAGDEVFHILGPNRAERARLTPAAKLNPTGTLTYPADASVEKSP
jgi:uncharacterized protein (DUF488 family)